MTKADPNIYRHFIDGAYVDPIDKEWFDIHRTIHSCESV
jgi:hypothetical protein